MTLAEYYMDRDASHPAELTPELRRNAEVIVTRATELLVRFGEPRAVTSGWRPRAINAATAGAAVNSKHMTCQAVDLADPDGDLDEWCLTNHRALEEIGLWLEHPAATKGWCHVQSVPPKSRNRVFYP